MNISTQPTAFGSAEPFACSYAAGLSGWSQDHREATTGHNRAMQLSQTLTILLQSAASRWLYIRAPGSDGWAIFILCLSFHLDDKTRGKRNQRSSHR